MVDEAGRAVECKAEEYGRVSFATQPGVKYRLMPRES
jgi:hypothetical protein